LERLLAMRFAATPTQRKRHKVHLVRYADDFIVTGTSKALLRDEVQPLVAHFLKERGLELSHEKTSITRVTRGFDFLGEHVRRYRDGKGEVPMPPMVVCGTAANRWRVRRASWL